MSRNASNKLLHSAKKSKNDEFYTQISDIERELQHYKKHFWNKIVYCNCDDPKVSNFFNYFFLNFKQLGIKKLITSFYSDNVYEKAMFFEYSGEIGNKDNLIKNNSVPFEGNGDFREYESIELLKQCDIVVTNPPFSLFREYINQVMQYDKKWG